MAQECIYNAMVDQIMTKIRTGGLMNEQLEDLFHTKIISKIESHNKLVGKYTILVKEMFQGVIHHRYCMGVAQKMVKLMKTDPDMEAEYACRICAEEMNESKGQMIFPLDEDTFAQMLKKNKCNIIHDENDHYTNEILNVNDTTNVSA